MTMPVAVYACAVVGDVPPQLGSLKALTDLRLHGNRLDGESSVAVIVLSDATRDAENETVACTWTSFWGEY